MKKSTKILICIIILIAGVILGYRAYLIYGKYKVTVAYNKTEGEIKIENSQACDSSINNYSICLPEGFVLDEENTVDKAVYLYHDSNYRNIRFVDVDEDLAQVFHDVDGSFDASNLLEDVNIHDTVDLLRYLDSYDVDIHYFSSLKDVKLNYALFKIFDNTVPTEKRSYITGDYTGYINYYDNDYEVNLIHNHRRYVIYFSSVDSPVPFTQDEVINIISSIHFKNQY